MFTIFTSWQYAADCLCQHIPNICRHCIRILMYKHKCVLPDLDLLSSPTMVLFKESKQNMHPNAQSTFLTTFADVFLAASEMRLPSYNTLAELNSESFGKTMPLLQKVCSP